MYLVTNDTLYLKSDIGLWRKSGEKISEEYIVLESHNLIESYNIQIKTRDDKNSQSRSGLFLISF